MHIVRYGDINILLSVPFRFTRCNNNDNNITVEAAWGPRMTSPYHVGRAVQAVERPSYVSSWTETRQSIPTADDAMASSPVNCSAAAANFSFSMYRELSSSAEGNVFASTYSLHLVLLLLSLGSKSKTNDQLRSVLHMPKNKSINYEMVGKIIERIEDPDYLTVANGVFSDKAFDLSADYENQARNYLKSEVRKLDFAGNPSAGESEINEWTKNKTNGKIPTLFSPGTIKETSLLVLASAVHFQNKWKEEFTETKNSTWCLSAKEHIQVPLMRQTGHFKYYKDDVNKFAALELPYQRGGFEMLVVLPDKMDAVKDLEKQLLSDGENFPALLANLTTHNVVVDLPKFKFESDLNLEGTMKNLGATEMFTPAADFSYASPTGKLAVSDIKHKTYVDVNESGTEAAGVTGINMVLHSMPIFPPDIKTVKFHACHPFLFIIKKGSHIIFMGRLANPNA